ncbi:MAG: siroheme synthase CysG [Pseudomonadota bacterium]
MKAFPMFIKTTSRRVIIVGGGEQAAQKVRLILKTDAHIVLAAQELDDELQSLVELGRATQHKGPLTEEFFVGAAMVFVASGCFAIDVSAHAVAKAARCPVNVVDQPDLCDMTTPSLVDRDPVVVAIGTEGTAPVLARQIKTRIEEQLPQSLGGLAALAGRLRSSVTARVPRARRRSFWRWVFAEAPMEMWAKGAEAHAAQAIKKAIANGGAPKEEASGSIALVGAGPGARDLLTLRAVQRLQEADIIFYDRLVGEEALELARRDAERIYVGKMPGAYAWPQDAINARIIAEAKKGHRVVRLKSGDPSIFGRAGEELTVARNEGIEVEIVPGITAACAAAASMGESLTQRGVTSRLVLATGTSQDGTISDAGTAEAAPGTRTAIYMGVRQAREIQAAMLEKGMPRFSAVTVATKISKPNEKIIHTTLSEFADVLEDHEITGETVLLFDWPMDNPEIKNAGNAANADIRSELAS